MKKSLLALSVLSAFAGVASAQTNVTVYGIVDAGFVREFGDGPERSKLTSGIKNGSRLGFKGTEDLGGGISANFLLENGFQVDNGTLGQSDPASNINRLFGRQAYVGLSSKTLGAINLGRQYAPIFTSQDSVDPFGTGLAGALTNIMASVVRVDNSIKYSTPLMGGLSADVLYGFGEVAGDSSESRTLGGSLNFSNGPIAATLAHTNVDTPAVGEKTKLTLLGGTFDFGVAKAHAAFQLEKGVATDARDYMIGVSAPIGAGTILASYIRKNDRTTLEQDADQIAVGYVHNLSKRTNVYTSFARISNDNDAGYTVGSAIESGETTKAFNIGVQHKF